MATIYVRSTDGLDTDSGETWALAKATLAGAISAAVAGDTIYVSHQHDETTDAAISYTSPGTLLAPLRIFCVNDGAEPPTALATTGIIKTTAGGNGRNIIFALGSVYVYGLAFSPLFGVTAHYANISLHNSTTMGKDKLVFEACQFVLPDSNLTNNSIMIGSSGNATSAIHVELKNCTLDYHGHANTLGIQPFNSVQFSGCTWLNANATAFAPPGTGSRSFNVMVEGCDLSAYGAGAALVNVDSLPAGSFDFRNCKLGAGVAASTGTWATAGSRLRFHNCDSADTNYRLWIEAYLGTIASETTWVRTGGASDGTTSYSWRLTSNSSAHLLTPLESPEIAIWNNTVGTPITVALEVLHDSATPLTDAECWLDVQYLGTTGNPLGSFANDRVATVFATPANQAASSESWTTTGMTNPNKQKLSVTVTPQEAGYIHCKVMLGKPSYTLVVDPRPVVS